VFGVDRKPEPLTGLFALEPSCRILTDPRRGLTPEKRAESLTADGFPSIRAVD
jgi:hypothetical protein